MSLRPSNRIETAYCKEILNGERMLQGDPLLEGLGTE